MFTWVKNFSYNVVQFVKFVGRKPTSSQEMQVRVHRMLNEMNELLSDAYDQGELGHPAYWRAFRSIKALVNDEVW